MGVFLIAGLGWSWILPSWGPGQ